VSVQYLRDLKEVLLAARPRTQASIAPANTASILATCRRCDGGIDGSAEIEPTPVICSSAMQPALDKSVVRCATKDRAIAGQLLRQHRATLVEAEIAEESPGE
jgi:hypothetical protein